MARSDSGSTLSLRALGRATLARQMLLARDTKSALAAIERLVGVQAQLARPPFIGLWSRVRGFRREDLATLLERREVVRATMMRATLHLVSASDYVTLRAAIQQVLDRGMRAVLKGRADGIDLERVMADARAFFGQKPCTFEALRAHLASLHPGADERAMGYVIRTGLPLVQVPTGGEWSFPAKSDFALADAWLGRATDRGERAPYALVRRYLAGYGPSSAADVQAWSGLPPPAVRDALAHLAPELRTFRDERGKELFDVIDAPRPDEDVAAPVRFLPEYDNVIVARADARLLAERHRKSVFLSALRVLPTFLVDGGVAGTWKIERKKLRATLAIVPFGTLAKKTRAELEEEGDALLRFVEVDATERAITFAKA